MPCSDDEREKKNDSMMLTIHTCIIFESFFKQQKNVSGFFLIKAFDFPFPPSNDDEDYERPIWMSFFFLFFFRPLI